MIHMILKDIWTCSNKHVKTCSDSIWYELLRFIWFSNMSELVQNQYDMNRYDSQTCLNLFRINLIWIDMILKHVWTCWNMSKLVQNQYDINCYDSQTCLNLFRINMTWIDMILKHVWTCWNMSKLVKNQSDMNWYDSQTCLNML